jgi:hypothetical protein
MGVRGDRRRGMTAHPSQKVFEAQINVNVYIFEYKTVIGFISKTYVE